MLNDFFYAFRTLRKSPIFTITVVVTLALAIGASTAIFSVTNGVLLRKLPYKDPERLVLARGDLQRGRELYGQACSACHGMNGAGAALGGENIAPSLQDVTPADVAEAIKIGPGQMPPGGGLPNYDFNSAESTQQVNDIAAYVESLKTRPYNRGGAPIGGKGPVPEGFVAWVIGLGVLILAARWIGGRA